MTVPLVKQTDRYVETIIDDETVVMDLDKAEFFSLNSTAGAVWRAIDGQRDRAGIAAALAPEFGTTPDAIAKDIDDLIESLLQSGFVAEG